MTGKLTQLKGKVLRNLSVATGDREGEARGKVEEESGQAPDDQELRSATEDVKEEHHDYGN
ncbi:MAG TPA: hypothetical protein VMZ22_09140 [Acidimicrobiales bacterium]|nr:hypothetical protein [Acidimicrobiales bacterium]